MDFILRVSSTVLCYVLSFSAYSGTTGAIVTSEPKNFISVSGGYYGSNYQANQTRYVSGILNEQNSFNNNNSSAYGQLALGTGNHLGGLFFDHQLVISKLNSGKSFFTANSKYSFSQNFDFGYDWMPRISVFQRVEAFAILGLHYARFHFTKYPINLASVQFDVYNDKFGFNLGGGLNYRINSNFSLGIKYQYWQYQVAQMSGYNPYSSRISNQRISPSFNLVGLELRYYWD